MVTLILAGCTAALASVSPSYEDETISIVLPVGWHVDGEAGEYFLESDEQDVASFLLLPFDPERPIDERLADIEEQFLATGIIRLELTESRTVEGVDIFYRRYRLMMAGSEEEDLTSILLHQYSFWRAEVQVLLQVETAPGRQSQEELFASIFHSLEIRRAPDPFEYREPQVD